MAYPDPLYERDIRPRVYDPAELGRTVSEQDAVLMTRFFGSVCQDLGIPYAGDGVIPETGDIPRVFLLVADEDGNEKPVSLQEAGISVESPEFWTQAYMGNVLMYPAGQKDPVQFLPDINDKGKMEYSKPITKDSIPPKAMEQPGGFARFMHWISGGRLFKNVDKYRTLQEKAALGKHFDQWQKRRIDTNLYEKDQSKTFYSELKKKRATDRLKKNIEYEKERRDHVKEGYKNLESVYKLTPVVMDRLLKTPGSDKPGLYFQNEFDAINPIGKDKLDLDTITIGNADNGGRKATEKDFIAITMFDAIWRADFSTPYTIDMFGLPCGRANSGSLLAPNLNPARDRTVEALNAYKEGNKTLLGDIVVKGLKYGAYTISDRVSPPTTNSRGEFFMLTHLYDVIDADPDLRQYALDHGVTKEEMKATENMKEYIKLDDGRRAARAKLGDNALPGNEKPLSKEEKEACVKDIVKASLVEQMWVSDNHTAFERDKKYGALPNTVLSMKDNKAIDHIADEIVKKYKIDEMSNEQLFDTFREQKFMTVDLMKKSADIRENMIKQEQLGKENAVANNEIKNEINAEVKAQDQSIRVNDNNASAAPVIQ